MTMQRKHPAPGQLVAPSPAAHDDAGPAEVDAPAVGHDDGLAARLLEEHDAPAPAAEQAHHSADALQKDHYPGTSQESHHQGSLNVRVSCSNPMEAGGEGRERCRRWQTTTRMTTPQPFALSLSQAKPCPRPCTILGRGFPGLAWTRAGKRDEGEAWVRGLATRGRGGG